MKTLLLLLLVIATSTLFAQDLNVDEVRVYKTKHLMQLLSEGKVVKSYRVMLSRGGMSPKTKAGDRLVPEGKYTLDFKNPYSKFYKSIHISYPNEQDIYKGYITGNDPGGDIMIHGLPNSKSNIIRILNKLGLAKLIDWTAGCVAVKNNEMEEIYENVPLSTPITIYH